MDFIKAFIIGGGICLIVQIIMDMTSYRITPGHVLVALVTIGTILSGLGLYEPVIRFGGAGATVPLTGFGHILAQGAITGVEEKGLLGAFSGGIEAAATGLTAAIVFGYFVAIIFNPKGE